MIMVPDRCGILLQRQSQTLVLRSPRQRLESTNTEKSADAGTQWQKDNNFAILTMKQNCEPEVVDIIGLTRNANDVYNELKAKYEGKSVTDLGAVLANVIRLIYDDRTSTINEQVVDFDLRATLARGFSDKLKAFGEALKRGVGPVDKNSYVL